MKGKGISRELICVRASREVKEGMYVNLGLGIPTAIPNFVPEKLEVVFQSENGILGYGRVPQEEEEWDFDLLNASGQPTVLLPGACFFDSSLAFGMIRGGHIDLTFLGGFQVSEKGDLANWASSEQVRGGAGSIGGSMDLSFGSKRVIVVMEHVTKDGKLRILKECTLPLTAKGCVNTILTDLAVLEVTPEGLVLKEVAPGITSEEVQEVTEPRIIIDPLLREIGL